MHLGPAKFGGAFPPPPSTGPAGRSPVAAPLPSDAPVATVTSGPFGLPKDNVNVERNITEANIVMLANLKWSDTGNIFMNLGCRKGKGLLACGDDQGAIWLYNLPQFGKDGGKPIKDKVEPTTKLKWAELQNDDQNNNSQNGSSKPKIIITNNSDDNH